MVVEFLKEYSWMAELLIPAFCAWVVWSFNQRFATRDDILSVENRLEARINALEAKLHDVPAVEALTKLQLTMEGLRGDMRAQEVGMEGLRSSIDSMQNQISMLTEHHIRNNT